MNKSVTRLFIAGILAFSSLKTGDKKYLESMRCENNKLKNLDVTKNIYLGSLSFNNNYLAFVNLGASKLWSAIVGPVSAAAAVAATVAVVVTIAVVVVVITAA